MMSMLMLALVVVMVVTMRPLGGGRKNLPPRPCDPLAPGRGLKVAEPDPDPERPGVVSYALMKDHKLPSPTQRALRRVLRPLAGTWIYRRFVPLKHDEPAAESRTGRSSRPSAELQNFLDARNREIARRKSEDDKPGPDDRLH